MGKVFILLLIVMGLTKSVTYHNCSIDSGVMYAVNTIGKLNSPKRKVSIDTRREKR